VVEPWKVSTLFTQIIVTAYHVCITTREKAHISGDIIQDAVMFGNDICEEEYVCKLAEVTAATATTISVAG